MKKDFYDLMLVDINIVVPASFLLIKITADNDNKGKIFGWLENIESSYYIEAKTFKTYFSDIDIYLKE